ncbi:hypothetical protein ZWY2020_054456 [Hordeum vulgare]|nr:hypothetical protein ZWY2020_054456 [Hordeum vulgare]
MCEKSTIRKRHMHLTEDILKQHPSICSHMEPSLNTRHDIVAAEVPKLGKEAERAIKEWGQPLSKITHVIFCTTSGVDMPGADYQLTRLLGLSPTVKRLMMYQQGCFGGATVLAWPRTSPRTTAVHVCSLSARRSPPWHSVAPASPILIRSSAMRSLAMAQPLPSSAPDLGALREATLPAGISEPDHPA